MGIRYWSNFAAVVVTLCTATALVAQSGEPSDFLLPSVECPHSPSVSSHAREAIAELRRAEEPGGQREEHLMKALRYARVGVAADSRNPWPQYLAGFAAVMLGDLERAVPALERALELCPSLTTHVADLHETAVISAISQASEATESDRLAMLDEVKRLYPSSPYAFYIAAAVYEELGNRDAALPNYRGFLARVRDPFAAGDIEYRTNQRAEMQWEAVQVMQSEAADRFAGGRFRQAAELYGEIAAAEANNRNAWYNYAMVLHAMNRWTELVPVSRHVLQLDPLTYNAHLLLASAYRGLSEQAAARGDEESKTANQRLALAALDVAESLPVRLEGITLEPVFSPPGGVGPMMKMSGQVLGGAAAAGTPLWLEFTLTRGGRVVGRGATELAAPPPGSQVPLDLTIRVPSRADAFSYSVRTRR